MTDKQIQEAADHRQAVEINKAINVTNAIAKVIEASRDSPVQQERDFDLPEYDCDHYDEEGQHGSARRF